MIEAQREPDIEWCLRTAEPRNLAKSVTAGEAPSRDTSDGSKFRLCPSAHIQTEFIELYSES